LADRGRPWCAVQLGLLAAAVSGAGNPHVKAVNWIIPGALGVLVGTICVLAGGYNKRVSTRPVECITSTVSAHVVRAGRASNTVLTVAGRTFNLPTGAFGKIATYRRIFTDQPYRVYVQASG